MPGLNIIPVQDSIVAYFREQFSAYEIFEDGILDDEYLLKQSNNIKPYIVITHGNINRSAANAAFGGVRFDEYTSHVDIDAVAPTGRQVREILNLVNDVAIGWKPTGGGALIPYASGGPWAVLNQNGAAHVYTGSTRFIYAINSEEPGSHITP